MFTQEDKHQIGQRALTEEILTAQIEKIRRGSAPLKISRAATAGKGILILDDKKKGDSAKKWEQEKENWHSEKFVPASGAASRMFKFLFQYLKDGQSNADIETFFGRLKEFPFYLEMESHLQKKGWTQWDNRETRQALLEYLLGHDGLNWSECPKGLLPFHSEDHHCLTPGGRTSARRTPLCPTARWFCSGPFHHF